MDCKEIQINFIDYFLKRLPFEQNQFVEYHVQQCGHCNEKYNRFKITMQSLDCIKLDEPSEQLRVKFGNMIRLSS
jgi:hypothetical protein